MADDEDDSITSTDPRNVLRRVDPSEFELSSLVAELGQLASLALISPNADARAFGKVLCALSRKVSLHPDKYAREVARAEHYLTQELQPKEQGPMSRAQQADSLAARVELARRLPADQAAERLVRAMRILPDLVGELPKDGSAEATVAEVLRNWIDDDDEQIAKRIVRALGGAGKNLFAHREQRVRRTGNTPTGG